MATALTIIKRALRLLGVEASGETPGTNESTEALEALNWMLDQWSNEKLMLYKVVNNLFTVTAGVTDYTVGPAGSGATWESSQLTRPMITQNYSAFVRSNISGLATDYLLEYWDNSRFQQIFQKQVSSNIPSQWTCDWAYPIATIRIYPKPTQDLQFGLSEMMQITKFGGLTETVVMPAGYEDALGWSLALSLAPEYGIEPSAVIVEKARETRFNIKRMNQQPVLMTADRVLLTKGIYNIYGDR